MIAPHLAVAAWSAAFLALALGAPGCTAASAVWSSDPDTLRAFGAVLVLGLVAALVMLGAELGARRRSLGGIEGPEGERQP